MGMLGIQIGGGSDAVLKALDRSLAMVEFEVSGKIRAANATFCGILGYSVAELQGRDDGLFVGSKETHDRRELWAKLRRGESASGVFPQMDRNGRQVWLHANLIPVKGTGGRVSKIIAIATDVTQETTAKADLSIVCDAISRSQAMIEFTPTGEILTANDNFLKAMGYRLEEIKGHHHRMFVDPAYAQSADYADFWSALARGDFFSSEYRRLAKTGEAVWIQASYNPVFDANGKVQKVIKVATDVTPRVKAVNAIGEGLVELAANNLRHRIDTLFDPAFARLRDDYNTAVSQL